MDHGINDKIVGSTNANEALKISLVQAAPDSPRILSSFNPQFTYPIFGDEEHIFGYQNLKINLTFAAHDLRPNLEILYDKKFKAVEDTKATDIKETLREWISKGDEETLSVIRGEADALWQIPSKKSEPSTHISKMTPPLRASSLQESL